MPQESFRIRQIHNHHKENEFALKIRGLRSQDFGEYECNVYSNRTRTQRSAALNVTGKNHLSENWKEMVFCYQNCSDLLGEEIFLVIEKIFEIRG